MSPMMASPPLNADAELDRLAQLGGELVIHVFDICGNIRRRGHRLPTGGRRVDTEAEQGEHAIADVLVGLATGVDHGLRGRAQETIDQEYDVEWQTGLGQR